MFLIVSHHVLIKGAETCGYTSPYSIQKDGIIGLCLNGLAIDGVNVFILISGWFDMGGGKNVISNHSFSIGLYMALLLMIFVC